MNVGQWAVCHASKIQELFDDIGAAGLEDFGDDDASPATEESDTTEDKT